MEIKTGKSKKATASILIFGKNKQMENGRLQLILEMIVLTQTIN
jgi:hypothetical protein